jgi:hypothetical protein
MMSGESSQLPSVIAVLNRVIQSKAAPAPDAPLWRELKLL